MSSIISAEEARVLETPLFFTQGKADDKHLNYRYFCLEDKHFL